MIGVICVALTPAVSLPACKMAGRAAGFDPQGTGGVLSEFYYCLAVRGAEGFARTNILVQASGSSIGDARATGGNDDS